MYSVLFVDDEPEVLAVLRRFLKRRQPEWICQFANSGADGLAAIEAADATGKRIDAVVADMRMPKMDGPTFLMAVREKHPEMIRIVLSGAADLEANLRVIPIAHQFLRKPINFDQLGEAVDRSCRLRDLLDDPALQKIVGEIDTLPVLPSVYAEMTKALADPRSSMESIGHIVEQEPGMSAKVLQMANSAFFGTAIPVGTIQQAVTFLGLPKIRQLLLVLEVFETFPEEHDNKKLRYFSLSYEREHALLCARVARELVSADEADHAFTAGLLHDIGKWVLATQLTERFAECFHISLMEDRPIEQVEKEILGATHAEVGAYLLALWGLPDPVVEAVAFHHTPARVAHGKFDVISAVHVANYLADPQPTKPLSRRSLDEEYLERLGVLGKMEEWSQRAQELFRGDS